MASRHVCPLVGLPCALHIFSVKGLVLLGAVLLLLRAVLLLHLGLLPITLSAPTLSSLWR